MEFSEAEKQLLIAVLNITRHKKTPDAEALKRFGENWFNTDFVNWTEAFVSLADKGLLLENNGEYSLPDQAKAHAEIFRKEYSSKSFSEWMIQSVQSKAYAAFCERVYGKNLCQCNLMDMEQLNKLII